MGSLESYEVVINLELFKLMRIYHFLDPNSRKLFNMNIYRLITVCKAVFFVCIMIYGQFGLFIDMEDTMDDVSLMLFIYVDFVCILGVLKIILLVYNADEIWELLYVARVDFLTSSKCRKYINILQNYGKMSTRVTQICIVLILVTDISWSIFPLILNATLFEEMTNRRMVNIFNFRYPVSIQIYNNYFTVLYIIELLFLILYVFVHLSNFLFITSIGYVLAAQYEIITQAFSNLGYEEHVEQNDDSKYLVENSYDEYKSILMDLQKFYLKLKSYYSSFWLIILLSIVLNSGGIMMLTYTFVVIFLSVESLPILSMFKLISPICFLLIELFYLCYLMEFINIKKESVAFGMYSSNWTAMNLKTKKILLLSMLMENTNKLMIKTTPRRIVNLQLFSNFPCTKRMMDCSSKEHLKCTRCNKYFSYDRTLKRHLITGSIMACSYKKKKKHLRLFMVIMMTYNIVSFLVKSRST